MEDAPSIHQIIDLLRQTENAEASSIPQLSEEDTTHLYNIAFQLYRNGKYEDAKHFFHFLTLSCPFDRRFWLGFGACQQMLKDYQAAIECYSVAAIQDPQDPYTHWHAAECFLASGQKEKGLAALHSALTVARQQPEYAALTEQLTLINSAWTKEGVTTLSKEEFQEALHG